MQLGNIISPNDVVLFFILGIPLIFISAVMLKTALNKGKRFLFAAMTLPIVFFVLIMGLMQGHLS